MADTNAIKEGNPREVVLKPQILAFFALAAFATTASADKPQTVAEPFRKLIDCRAITAPDQRLACYDTTVAALDSAQKKKDIVVVSKADVKEARKSLFGFQLPNFSLFSPGEKIDKADDIEELITTVAGASQTKGGDWSLTLEKGGVWETRGDLDFPPRRGDKVVIHKASLGSFLGQIGPAKGVRMRRVG